MVIIPIIVLLILLLPFSSFYVLSWSIMALAVWEWMPLAGYTKLPGRVFGVIAIIGLGVVISLAGLLNEQRTTLWFALLLWLLLTPLVLTFPLTQASWSKSRLWRVVMVMMIIIPCGCALTVCADKAWRVQLLFGLILIWGADISAYFAGHKWGKLKLLPAVSPGKTLAGFMGAVLSSMVISVIFWAIITSAWLDDGARLVQYLVIGVMTVSVSVMGDLMESMMKRNAGVKDSGQLIPGHGGLLDRIDSMLAALPIFVLLNLLQ